MVGEVAMVRRAYAYAAAVFIVIWAIIFVFGR